MLHLPSVLTIELFMCLWVWSSSSAQVAAPSSQVPALVAHRPGLLAFCLRIDWILSMSCGRSPIVSPSCSYALYAVYWRLHSLKSRAEQSAVEHHNVQSFRPGPGVLALLFALRSFTVIVIVCGNLISAFCALVLVCVYSSSASSSSISVARHVCLQAKLCLFVSGLGSF